MNEELHVPSGRRLPVEETEITCAECAASSALASGTWKYSHRSSRALKRRSGARARGLVLVQLERVEHVVQLAVSPRAACRSPAARHARAVGRRGSRPVMMRRIDPPSGVVERRVHHREDPVGSERSFSRISGEVGDLEDHRVDRLLAAVSASAPEPRERCRRRRIRSRPWRPSARRRASAGSTPARIPFAAWPPPGARSQVDMGRQPALERARREGSGVAHAAPPSRRKRSAHRARV